LHCEEHEIANNKLTYIITKRRQGRCDTYETKSFKSAVNGSDADFTMFVKLRNTAMCRSEQDQIKDRIIEAVRIMTSWSRDYTVIYYWK